MKLSKEKGIMPKMIFLEGPMKGETFEWKGQPLLLGRSPKNDVKVKDIRVSRKHCRVFKVKERYFIEDLQSTNGTWLNNHRLNPGNKYEIEENDFVTIGETVIRLIRVGKKPKKTKKAEKPRHEAEITEKKPPAQGRHPKVSPKDQDLFNRASKLIEGSFDRSELMAKVLEYLLNSLSGTDTASIVLLKYWKDKYPQIEKVFSRSREGLARRKAVISRRIMGQAVREKKPVKMSEPPAPAPDESIGSGSTIRMGAALCVPVLKGSVVKAVIYLESLEGRIGFQEEDMVLLSQVGNLLVMALDVDEAAH
jgi:hypothetical protein